jgi:hypothetical protein
MVKRYKTSQYSGVWTFIITGCNQGFKLQNTWRVKKPCEPTLPKPNAKTEKGEPKP